MESYYYDVFGVLVVQFTQCYIVYAVLSVTDAFMFQCYSSSSSSSGGGLAAIVCHWQFTIEASFLVLQFVYSYSSVRAVSHS
jgi:hypothetical protein